MWQNPLLRAAMVCLMLGGLCCPTGKALGEAVVGKTSAALPTYQGTSSTVPAGSTFSVQLLQPITSALAKVGEGVSVQLEEDWVASGVVVAPAQSVLKGKVVAVRPAGMGSLKYGELQLLFTELQRPAPFAPLALQATIKTSQSDGTLKGESYKGVIKEHGKTVLKGAAIGAASGAVLAALGRGGNSAGKGALVGAGIGLGVGLAQAVISSRRQSGREVELQSGQSMLLVLKQPLQLGGSSTPYRVIRLTPTSPPPNAGSTPSGTYYGY